MLMSWQEINNNCLKSADKYKYYFGTYTFEDFGKGKIAKQLPVSTVGWGSRAVEMRSNKTTFDCFENDELKLTEVAERYHLYEAINRVKEDILVAGCGFIGLAGDRVLPFTAEEASGLFDWREQNLRFGAAKFSNKVKEKGLYEYSTPSDYIIYEKDATRTMRDGDKEETIYPNPTGRPLMGLLTYRSTVKRPFGNSVLNQAARSAIVDASRTTRQAMISAYYYNSKVDVILGADADTDIERVETQTGDIIKLSPNENGQNPAIGEFAQHAMTPFTDTILIAARNFCTATKLVLSNLGISSDAPQSPEALEIVSDDLRDDISQWHNDLGEQIKYFCLTLFMYENGLSKVDDNIMKKYNATVPVFKPTYRSDVSKVGDGIFKLAEKAPGVLLSRALWRNLGLDSRDIDIAIQSALDNPNLTL